MIRRAIEIQKDSGTKELIARIPAFLKWRVKNIRSSLRCLIFNYSGKRPIVPMSTYLGNIELEVDPSWRRYDEMASGNMYEPMLQQKLINTLSEDDVFYNIGSR